LRTNRRACGPYVRGIGLLAQAEATGASRRLGKPGSSARLSSCAGGAFYPLFRHLLPNILQPVLAQATIGVAGAILAESALSFLGLGVLAPVPSWGAMLNDARGHLFDAQHMVVFPALAVMTAVLSFNLLGDAWRDWFDPRTRAQMAAQEFSR
jgi:hypothetical protein